ncbi:choice-of-anchor B family protein [Acanthopleuribacter pedis]|uniref:Choice-of-anchor B family protein n=1 Tax=Acanthopleuribacter pedis TaxID=442870 RepID=A0A8J7U1V0_9BACT|nr:choice-of-anchor B family protein [Acanthopleuribacter pedis]MBO1317912.1 choice-of-anchor B family protein [Acanthopleuribacter pedis]
MHRFRISNPFVKTLTILLCSGFLVLAHQGDPKVRDEQPRYEGPGYQQGAFLGKNGPEFQSSGLVMHSWMTLAELGNQTRGNDCWGYTAPSGREYAIMGLRGGTAFVEITNPAQPALIEFIEGPSSSWRDVKTYSHYAYIVTEGGEGIQVVNLANVDQGEALLVNTVTTGGATATHNVAINEESGYLYRTGGSSNGLRIYDLANPAAPEYVGAWSDRYVHDAQIVTYTEGPYAGREIAFACAGFNGGSTQTGLSIVDVTDKQNIQVITHYQFSNPNYSHQGWLSEDRRYFYLNDELDESRTGSTTTTRVIDVSDLENPFEASTFTTGLRAIDHNLYTHQGMIFQANYRSGLRVFETSDPLAPTEIAYFDTYPDNNNPNFNGLWSVYPYFPSGTIIGSDLEKGLFVWRLTTNGCNLKYDQNGDCLITLTDVRLLHEAWLTYCDECTTDVDGSGRVNVRDMVMLVNNIAQ